MVVIFYLVLFLPMRRRQRKADEMLKNLKNGDRVVTTGGVIGTIVALGDDNTLTLRVKPDNLKMQFTRAAVTGLVESEEEKK
jgi:preprotein translocase subunit YajC